MEMADNHPITTAPATGRVVVRWRGRVVADTTHALALSEANYPPVLYIPRADANMKLFERSARETTCPYKGEANYFTLRDGEEADANAVWTYEQPKPVAAAIKDHLAFYPDRVQIERRPAD
ncbi:MAG: DUF427 domain-containing protein [Bradyrhizobium sp.]|nr:MAG: DUF427 domain-containing protein [Bradyrhizobium sp.]